ncbi:hypothetical protein ONZ43_g3100 [Nemania bipapillata]|uniref:Uncharacterized protein n=1 Tax=Nemania bipapillata TaxID=110536 RepID=A0ACC2IY39_9PEZI|nr:hypothetical protein ONZ43_g3100 [Nemania bipapillata]
MASELPTIAPIEPTKLNARDTIERTTSSSSSIAQNEVSLNQRALGSSDQIPESGGVVAGTGEYANGYHFPPKYPMKEQIRMGIVAYWEFYNTGFGFFFTVYALNVVGWGFMLLLLLLSASPQMCWVNGKFDCDDINSQRRIWIEIDSQVLTALFSATGFGLVGWRVRDLYLLLRYRINKDQKALRRLAGVHRAWLRLEGSDQLPPTLGPKNIEETTVHFDTNSVPYPLETISDPPPTGIRAPPSKLWKMDFIAWLNIWYIVFQGFLSGFMWALSRYNRPAWTTGLFFALTFITSSAAGIMEALQVLNVRAIEGVPLTKRDIQRLARDKELGIPHYNNIKDKDPEEEQRKKEEKKARRKNRFSRRSEKAASESTV